MVLHCDSIVLVAGFALCVQGLYKSLKFVCGMFSSEICIRALCSMSIVYRILAASLYFFSRTTTIVLFLPFQRPAVTIERLSVDEFLRCHRFESMVASRLGRVSVLREQLAEWHEADHRSPTWFVPPDTAERITLPPSQHEAPYTHARAHARALHAYTLTRTCACSQVVS